MAGMWQVPGTQKLVLIKHKCPALMNLVKKTGNDQIKCMGGQTDGKRERERERRSGTS